jgi:hypothetical protein
MAELAELAASAGVVVQDKIIQRRSAIDPGLFSVGASSTNLLFARFNSGRTCSYSIRTVARQVRSLSKLLT